MKIKPNLLKKFLREQKMSIKDFAKASKLKMSEIKKLLNGEVVSEEIAHYFIGYFGAEEAQQFIDWDSMGIKNPYTNGVGT